MRVVSILTALTLLLGCAACGGGGGPGDLSLGGPTSAPVTTTTASRSTTTAPGHERALVARARFSQLAVYNSPDAPQPTRVLDNPWTPTGPPRERFPQVLL